MRLISACRARSHFSKSVQYRYTFARCINHDQFNKNIDMASYISQLSNDRNAVHETIQTYLDQMAFDRSERNINPRKIVMNVETPAAMKEQRFNQSVFLHNLERGRTVGISRYLEPVIYSNLMNNQIHMAFHNYLRDHYKAYFSKNCVLVLFYYAFRERVISIDTRHSIIYPYDCYDIVDMAAVLAWHQLHVNNLIHASVPCPILTEYSSVEHFLQTFDHYNCFVPRMADVLVELVDSFHIPMQRIFQHRRTQFENVPYIAKKFYARSDERRFFKNGFDADFYKNNQRLDSIAALPSTYDSIMNIPLVTAAKRGEPTLPDILESAPQAVAGGSSDTDMSNYEQYKQLVNNKWRIALTNFLIQLTSRSDYIPLTKASDVNYYFTLLFKPEDCPDIAKHIMRLVIENNLMRNGRLTPVNFVIAIGHLIGRLFREKADSWLGKTRVVDEATRKYIETVDQRDDKEMMPREYWISLVQQKYGIVPINHFFYFSDTAKYGAALEIAQFIISNFTITLPSKEETNALYSKLMVDPTENTESVYLVPHDDLIRLYDSRCRYEDNYSMDLLPNLFPCTPWITYSCGVRFGPACTQVQISRKIAHSRNNDFLEMFGTSNRLAPVMDALTSLGNIAWKVNTNVLDVIKHYYNANESNPKLDMLGSARTLSLFEISQRLRLVHTGVNKVTFAKRAELIMEMYQRNNTQYSQWLALTRTLTIADFFVKNSPFFFGHNVDFRGRAYPISPYFNHYGPDIMRSLFLFHKGRPIYFKKNKNKKNNKNNNKDGLFWIKVHLANVYGKFKRGKTNAERAEWTDTQLKSIYDTVANPIVTEWWKDADSPWQTLATCFELVDALNHKDDPNYLSHLPIHQDGSCNGLQHYAALGRDIKGAKSVNLVNSPRPNDVYQDVADIVRASIKDENPAVYEILQNGKLIDRSLVKQTVMTHVYGVTPFGAKLQILKRLKDTALFDDSGPSIDAANPNAAGIESTQLNRQASYVSTVLAEHVFKALKCHFNNATIIQEWLQNVAEYMSIEGEHPTWVSVVGMPVFQYNENLRVEKSLDAYKLMSAANKSTPYTQPDTRRNVQSLPPNFIHSLDACHMFLTALACQNAGIAFSAVHDSFWTHAADVNTMNRLLREEFVNLHSQDLLKEFARDVQEMTVRKTMESNFATFQLEEKGVRWSNIQSKIAFNNNIFRNIPQQGEFDLSEVLESEYFFS